MFSYSTHRLEIANKIIEENGYDLLVRGHTHNPCIIGKLDDCGNIVQHSTYVIIKDRVSRLIEA